MYIGEIDYYGLGYHYKITVLLLHYYHDHHFSPCFIVFFGFLIFFFLFKAAVSVIRLLFVSLFHLMVITSASYNRFYQLTSCLITRSLSTIR